MITIHLLTKGRMSSEKNDIFVFDKTYPWTNKKLIEKIVETLNVTPKQKAFLVAGKNYQYLSFHCLGIKGKEVYLFNHKHVLNSRIKYSKKNKKDYLFLRGNIYQYSRLKEAKKYGIKSGIYLDEKRFYLIDEIIATKSGNLKIPVDEHIRKYGEEQAKKYQEDLIRLNLNIFTATPSKEHSKEYAERLIEIEKRKKQRLEEQQQQLEKGRVIDFFGRYLDEWERCPYRLIRSIKEGVNPYDKYTDSVFVKEVLVKRGIDFEVEKLSEIKWKKTKESLEKLIEKRYSIKKPYLKVDGSKITFDVPLYFKKIVFKGTPEMIREHKGNMVPLDVKSHKGVTTMDEERISYYSFLIKALYGIEPTYGLIWAKNGAMEVKIRDFHLRTMFDKIEKIWFYANSTEMPPQQRTNQCSICSLDKSCVKDLRERGDLTLIYGVGPATVKKMRNANIHNIDELLSQNNFLNHKLQAEAMVKEKIIKIGEMEDLPYDVVYVDTETNLGGGLVWLIGYLHKGEFQQLYADKESEEKNIIKEFLDFLKSLNNPIFVEYSATNFDYRNILDAAEKHKLDSVFFSRVQQIDLFWPLKNAYLFPTLSRQLKEIAHHLGYPSKTELDGPTVAIGYQEHLMTGEPIPKEYFVYNEDDVRMLPFIVKEVRIATESKKNHEMKRGT